MDAAGDEYRYEISSACILVLTSDQVPRCQCVDLIRVILPPVARGQWHSVATVTTVGDRSGQSATGPVRSGHAQSGNRAPVQNPRAAAH